VALPVFREIMLRVYEAKLVGPAPKFPREIEEGIDRYLALRARGDPLPMPPGTGLGLPPAGPVAVVSSATGL
jgi:hypothetical protein